MKDNRRIAKIYFETIERVCLDYIAKWNRTTTKKDLEDDQSELLVLTREFFECEDWIIVGAYFGTLYEECPTCDTEMIFDLLDDDLIEMYHKILGE